MEESALPTAKNTDTTANTKKTTSTKKKTASVSKGYRLVIVESPAKARTISKFLGRSYRVEASNGHVRDLPKSRLGVDVENDFEPKYISIRGRGEVIERLKKEAKGAREILLATDPDREGEAISWHLCQILGLDPATVERVEFPEITKRTVQRAVKEPRHINMKLVDAQQARRVLDRLGGDQIGPILWAKIKRGLSAGRVQSVSTRMVVDREQEINDFIPEEYWTLSAQLHQGKTDYTANLFHLDGKKPHLTCEAEAKKAQERVKTANLILERVTHGEKKRHPAPPFTTSNLQQEASRKLNFTTAKTMQIAQQLYEGVDVKGMGTIGLISYIRTDSVRLSDEAVQAARTHIQAVYGDNYVPEKPNVFRGRKSAQDAHEAIRPANAEVTPEMVKDSLTRDQYRLYELIYRRFIACQMADAVIDTLQIDTTGDGVHLRSNAERMRFAGFTAVYETGEERENLDHWTGEVQEGASVTAVEVEGIQHFTQPPARYTEATLVRALEEKGIGRPSTYAPTISTIISRGYVTREKKQLVPTELGNITTALMKEAFSDIVDEGFTAEMEEKLDEVEEGKLEWKGIIRDFYGPFSEELKKAENELEKYEIHDEESDVICEKCGARMVYKMGRFGRFLACPNFPECRNTKNIEVVLKAPCPKCGGRLLEKTSRKGRRFYGCEHFPECDFVSWNPPVERRCPKCGAYMTRQSSRKGVFDVCSNDACRTRVEEEQ